MSINKDQKSILNLRQVKGFKAVHLNIRSLPKKIDQLRILLHDSGIDVFTISETWLKESLNSKLFDIEGFNSYRLDRAGNCKNKKRGGGLITYIHSKHAASTVSLGNLDASVRDIEVQWLKICRPHCKDVIIGNLYRPPTGKLANAIEYIDECLKSLNLTKNDVFILGDINVNYKNKSSTEYKKLNFFAKSNGLSQLTSSTTRNTQTSKSLHDIILTNSKYVSEAGTLEHYISDHQPVYVVKKKKARL